MQLGKMDWPRCYVSGSRDYIYIYRAVAYFVRRREQPSCDENVCQDVDFDDITTLLACRLLQSVYHHTSD
jgi:hypothetical protein